MGSSMILAYSPRISINTLLAMSKAIWTLYDRCSMFYTSSIATYTTKASFLGSNAILTTSLWFTSLIFFFISKALIIVYIFHSNYLSANLIFVLYRKKKSIPKTTSILVLTFKKVFSKNRFLSCLSYKEKSATPMLRITKVVLSIL